MASKEGLINRKPDRLNNKLLKGFVEDVWRKAITNHCDERESFVRLGVTQIKWEWKWYMFYSLGVKESKSGIFVYIFVFNYWKLITKYVSN